MNISTAVLIGLILAPACFAEPAVKDLIDDRHPQPAATQPATMPSTTKPANLRYPDSLRSATNLHIIGIALMRYVKDKGAYPEALSDLKSNDITDKTLTCPIDGKPYVYIKPAVDAPPHTAVAYEGTPSSRGIVNVLWADGVVEGYREADAKKRIENGER